MAPIAAATLAEILDACERRELPLLTWGVVDGHLAEAEVLDVIGEVIADAPENDNDLDPNDVLDAMLDNALLHRVRAASTRTYRTRFAESVRLLANLRQLFPAASGAQSWTNAKRLVADFRVETRPRRYPRRDIPVDELIAQLAQASPRWHPRDEAVLRAYLGADMPLARFQVDATATLLADLDRNETRAMIVAAGTGSGKTLAFYLPTFISVARQLQPAQHAVQVLAIYPRTELLKDQVREAFGAARRLDAELQRQDRRPLRLGAYFGATPHDGRAADRKWRRQGNGLRCPFLDCPVCAGALLWLDSDRSAGREQLTCRRPGCSGRVTEDQLALSRKAMDTAPPDVLFTTTEMLNRRMADTRGGDLFGVTWGATAKPRILLLDEVHTYQGVSGAQVALLLRRWRNAVGRPVTVVGLSATLRDASTFMARLTGVHDTSVDHITPAEEDLLDADREYLVATRGDPLSGTSLLSTTIQSAMLLGRVHNPEHPHQPSTDLFGSRSFVFTDDLDITNRLYYNLRDAEGNRPGRSAAPLANLRASNLARHNERYTAGQSWDLVEDIGHDLHGPGLRVGRTSSQDPGVADTADVIVATGSLDVGFNDPRVEMIVQHKAPRQAAQFIQRRGRAGRTRLMRPWTTVILSDYGRDRLTYQAYEELFDPELPTPWLPVHNRSVLRMQAMMALLDWLAPQLPGRGDLRRDLTAPTGPDPRRRDARADALLRLIDALLSDEGPRASLRQHLMRALGIDAGEVEALLWEPPRALLTAALPTIRRRLKAGWDSFTSDPGAAPGTVLPEFIPTALFNPLALPEVSLLVPQGTAGETSETLPVQQALREFTPGRVSKRYAVTSGALRHWLPLPTPTPTHAGPVELDLADLVPRYAEQGTWTADGHPPLRVIRPYALRLTHPPAAVPDTSNAQPRWATQIHLPFPDATDAAVPDPSPWTGLVNDIGFFAHAHRNAIEMRRLTLGSDATVRDPHDEHVVSVTYTLSDQPVALGFAFDCDALRIRLAAPDLNAAPVNDYLNSPEWRSALLGHRIRTDPVLGQVTNVFRLTWLHLVVLSALTREALRTGDPLPDCANRLLPDLGGHVDDILAMLFRATPVVDAATDDADPSDTPAGHVTGDDRLAAGLKETLGQPAVVDRLRHLLAVLWEPPGAPERADAEAAVYATVGSACLSACLSASPDATDTDLALDIRAADGPGAELWITETTTGGAGVLERVYDTYAGDPRRFWRLVHHTLGPSDREIVDDELTAVLGAVGTHPDDELARCFDAVRRAADNTGQRAAVNDLLAALQSNGAFVSHPVVSALSARLLRPGSSPATDRLLLALIQGWRDAEQRLNVEIDARVWAYCVAGEPQRFLTSLAGAPTLSADQIFSLLWPRGHLARNIHLDAWHPFGGASLRDRRLVAALLHDLAPEVDVTRANWFDAFTHAVVNTGVVDLVAASDQVHRLRHALLQVAGSPVEYGFLHVYPGVRAGTRERRGVRVRCELRESYQ